jgi:hypothetical protein
MATSDVDSLKQRLLSNSLPEGASLEVPEVQAVLGGHQPICRRKVFAMLATGELLRAPRFGKRTLILAASVANALRGASPLPQRHRRGHRPAPVSVAAARAMVHAPASTTPTSAP